MKEILGTYGFLGFLRLINDLILTRIFNRPARLIRRPLYIRGGRYIKIGLGFTSGVGLRLDAFPTSSKQDAVLIIGKNVQVNDYVHIGAIDSITIGDNTLIASKVFITDHNHGLFEDLSELAIPPIKRELSSKAVHIGANVWIGENVSILPGVKIGDGSIIGAGSVVTKDIPKNVIAVGAPARVIKEYGT